ncbi:uracil-DNA glycosylase family 4 [Phyllobacterium ifriqiyense]|uniref:Type-4 uracil-DNA glycosylase n=1 Tax=Phyllobacterium ifriqiyense TaxID=314238 RepID=A0ABU0SCQ4_9HYPH|nr:uracil-DNA glycosylase [Phyllobacterium ifriqiyense]MDQ0998552.1 uracil-DNA glycosylase family 4 [Phyllobacterium ifriqiyense]
MHTAICDFKDEKDYPLSTLSEILHFYAEAGVDTPLVDTPVDRFSQVDTKRAQTQQAPVATRSNAPSPAGLKPPIDASASAPSTLSKASVPDDAKIAMARQMAANATTLEELREQLAAFDGCNLKFTAKNLVFADGNPQAAIMFVGEAPGREEDLEGIPFIGRSGQLLDRMLAAIGLDRQSVYIANTIPWRPPGNRTPTPLETEICRPFFERQIELANPKLLVALGGPAAKALTNAPEGILRLRGNWKTHLTGSGNQIPVMPTLHPAYLLRNSAQKKFAWRDFLSVKLRLRALTD